MKPTRPSRGREPALDGAPPPLPPFLRSHADGVTIAIRLQPRASRMEIGELTGNELKIKVTAPPVDSAANEALVQFLAKVLGCPRNQVELIRGQTSRSKVVRIHGGTGSVVAAKLAVGNACK